MSTWRDIAVNLLSNAIWAIGGYAIPLLPFFKKSILSNNLDNYPIG